MPKKNTGRRPVILVTNDDGIRAKGLHSLVEMVKPFGRVVVVAPEEGNSGMSHAITIKNPLRIRKHKRTDDVDFYSVNGTPVDCVKLAMNQLFKSQPDLLVSGINHGSNSSVSIFYSGTMAAVIEGCLYGIPSIGFSLLDFNPEADFSGAIEHGKPVVEMVLENGLTTGSCLNVNFPAISKDSIKGIKVCRQNKGTWREEFEKRIDPRGHEYFWLTGYFQNEEPKATDTDEHALSNGYVSIVPVSIDLTSYNEVVRLKSLLHSTKKTKNEKEVR
ncbi:MAG TPA: 5'/3'-nucleotidase SurE [Tenuifilaceae bacterium]|nr:5'/3'-nucleotidase SurE [Tenuifilaceae bacterium]HPJ46997.1 5'/3'-nucleotidase SurE [Tenuifilaceae bacterium]HPQ33258.1 5'/3'-nucleotidase SurE [Tenuifilaceae bacterium]HRX69265.1 5'/3'-nucleotidase SurE [Tenuifilaceae bacterium]